MKFTRRSSFWLPVSTLIFALFVVEVVQQSQSNLALNQHRADLVTRANDARAVLERELYPAIYVSVGLSSYIVNRSGSVDEQELTGWLSNLFTESRYLRNIAIAPDNRISLVYPLAENQAILGLYYSDVPQQWLVVQTLMNTRQPQLQGPINLVQGGQGLIYRIPVFIDDEYWGLVSTVIDAERLLSLLEQYSAASQLSISLRVAGDGADQTPFWRSGMSSGSFEVAVPLELQGIEWLVQVSAPTQSGWLDNTYRWLGWSLALVFSAFMYFWVHSTLRRQSVQARYEANEERLQAILDGTHIGTWEWNVQTGETRFNERWAEIAGYTLAELHPVNIETWQRLAHPDDLVASAEQLQLHFDGKQPYYDIRCRMKHKEGHWVWVHDRGQVMSRTPDGKPLMMFGTHADVTEEVEAQQALQEQKDLLRVIVDNIPINVYIKDRSGRKVMANRAERLFMGLDPDAEDIGLHDSEFLPPELAQLSGQEDQRVFDTGESILAAEYDSRGPDGKPMWQLVSKIPLKNEQGETNQLLGITVDITGRKAAEVALQASRDQYLSLVENIPGISYRCLFDDEWTMLFVSAQVDTISGYPATDFINNAVRSYASLIEPEDDERNRQTVSAAIAEGRPWEIKYRVRHCDGSLRWAYEKGQAVMDDQGDIAFLDGFVLDITEQVQAETAMQDSEARLRALFELSPVGIALNDYSDGTFLDVNEALLTSTGYTREAFLRLNYWQITPQEYLPYKEATGESLRTTGRYGPIEKEIIDAKGDTIPVRLSGVLIRDRTGRKLIWSIIEDVREQKRVERLKQEFISTVSHELRTPLTAIAGSLSLVKSGVLGTLPPEVLNLVTIAHDSSQRLTLLINDLLDMDKLIAGKMTLALQKLDAAQLIERAVRENQPYADKYSVQLNYVGPTNPILVTADEQRFIQVMTNLLSNAAKFTADNSTVEISVETLEDHLRICVRDQGMGIPPEFQDKIFSQFSQADASDTRRRGGTGLGLAISKRLVEMMNGHIGYETTQGQGTCFYFDLPLSDPAH